MKIEQGRIYPSEIRFAMTIVNFTGQAGLIGFLGFFLLAEGINPDVPFNKIFIGLRFKWCCQGL